MRSGLATRELARVPLARLHEILALHDQFNAGDPRGKRADLEGARMAGTELAAKSVASAAERHVPERTHGRQ
jgi:hypothetical protein